MELTAPAFMPEINRIINSLDTNVHFNWSAQVITKEGTISPLQLISIDIDRDFVNNYADNIVVRLVFGHGTYAQKIAPFKNDLKITLKRISLGARGSAGEAKATEDVEETFRATLLNAKQEKTSIKHSSMTELEAGDLMGIRYVDFQLQDLCLEQIRVYSLGSSFRNVVPGDVMRGILTKASQEIKIDTELAIQGVEMSDYSNKEVFDHVIIPHATPLHRIPDFIQNEGGGVYSAGLGFYLFKGWWYVWPLYDLVRHDKVKESVTLMILPPNFLNGSERTYRITGNQVIILITGETIHVDLSEGQLYNEGNAVRYSDPRKLIEGFAEVENNKVSASRPSNNTEYLGVDKSTGFVNAKLSDRRSTRNSYREASRIAARNGSLMMLTWQNSNPDLLKPNIPVKVMYVDDGLPVTLKATLVGVQSEVRGLRPGVTNNHYQTNTVLKVFAERELPVDEL